MKTAMTDNSKSSARNASSKFRNIVYATMLLSLFNCKNKKLSIAAILF